ncbi:unnamed protein product [Polarella glacialis]|uniref:Serine protease n=2 Tax=Polarella glacialis TaxID=89957 RepID=A0A813DQ70_POLGL|nr:unnamed protein product [Polarella glacialis]
MMTPLLRSLSGEVQRLPDSFAPSRSGSLPSRPMSRQSLAQSVRRGVALLWFEATGSWASAVVVSERGHLLTCAHLLTGSSWMESAPESQEQPSASNSGLDGKRPTATRRLAPSQQICRGRCEVLGPDGFFQEVTFEAQVLCVCEGYLDAALLLARPPSRSPDSKSRGYLFEPWIWQRESRRDPEEGTAVWAVGHGLFGPGTPWRGATLTEGHVVKVARSGCFPGGRAAVLQSSAAVHRGCSGGALVDACTGELLGMVTTNVKHQDGSVMPHVNFSLPAGLMAPLRSFLEDPFRQGALDKLLIDWRSSAADEREQALWRLEPEPLQLPSRMAARKQLALDRMRQLTEDATAAEEQGENAPPKSAL